MRPSGKELEVPVAKISPDDWKAVFALLDTALDLSVDERRRWIESLDSTHSHLSREVRELIARHASYETSELARRDFLEKLPQFTEVNLGAAESSPQARAGDIVGAYRLLSVLGRGGMGEVWLAERADGRFEGRCAIKFLDAAAASPKLVERFRHEGRMLARLTHHNIARLIDAGATESGRPYLALEYVAGERIDAYCERNHLSIAARVHLFTAVVAAVAHAHAQLVIHRDLKPSNVLVTEEGEVKLLDFGIAKLLAEHEEDATRTRIEDVALTPEYAAPEQLLGESPTTATDVYQLGLLLYVLLAGRHPLPPGGRRAERIRLALEHEIPKVSESAPAASQKSLQGDLDAIVGVALRRVPQERFATAQAFGDELHRYLRHEPVLARRGATLYRARKFFVRHQLAVGVATAAIASICLALVFSLVQMQDARTQRDQARFAVARAEMSNDFMNLMLSEIGAGDRALTMPELLERTEQMLSKQYTDKPEFVAAMLIELASRYHDVSRTEKAVALLGQSAALAERLGNGALRARALCASSRDRFETGKPELAETDFAQAAAVLKQLHAPSVDVQVECLRAQAQLARSKAQFAETLRFLNAAHEIQERTGATKSAQYTSVLNEIGGLYLVTGAAPEAYAAFKQADEAFERNGREGTVAKLTQESNLAIPLTQMGEVAAAARIMQHIMDRSSVLQTFESSRLAYVMNYAHLLVRLDESQKAWQLLEGAREQAAAENDPTIVAWVKFQSGKARFGMHDYEAAERFIEEAEAALRKEPTRNGVQLRTIRLERARQALARGWNSQAKESIAGLLRELNYPEKRKGVELRNTLVTAAAAELASGDLQGAEDFANAAYSISMQLARSPDLSADIGELLLLQARIQMAHGDRSTDRELLTRAVRSLTNGLGAEHHLTREAAALLADHKT